MIMSNNPLFNALSNNNTPKINDNFKNMMNVMKGGNPMSILQNMAMQNPQLQPYIQMLNKGANPEQLVRQICKERNINVDELLKQFR